MNPHISLHNSWKTADLCAKSSVFSEKQQISLHLAHISLQNRLFSRKNASFYTLLQEKCEKNATFLQKMQHCISAKMHEFCNIFRKIIDCISLAFHLLIWAVMWAIAAVQAIQFSTSCTSCTTMAAWAVSAVDSSSRITAVSFGFHFIHNSLLQQQLVALFVAAASSFSCYNSSSSKILAVPKLYNYFSLSCKNNTFLAAAAISL